MNLYNISTRILFIGAFILVFHSLRAQEYTPLRKALHHPEQISRIALKNKYGPMNDFLANRFEFKHLEAIRFGPDFTEANINHVLEKINPVGIKEIWIVTDSLNGIPTSVRRCKGITKIIFEHRKEVNYTKLFSVLADLSNLEVLVLKGQVMSNFSDLVRIPPSLNELTVKYINYKGLPTAGVQLQKIPTLHKMTVKISSINNLPEISGLMFLNELTIDSSANDDQSLLEMQEWMVKGLEPRTFKLYYQTELFTKPQIAAYFQSKAGMVQIDQEYILDAHDSVCLFDINMNNKVIVDGAFQIFIPQKTFRIENIGGDKKATLKRRGTNITFMYQGLPIEPDIGKEIYIGNVMNMNNDLLPSATGFPLFRRDHKPKGHPPSYKASGRVISWADTLTEQKIYINEYQPQVDLPDAKPLYDTVKSMDHDRMNQELEQNANELAPNYTFDCTDFDNRYYSLAYCGVTKIYTYSGKRKVWHGKQFKWEKVTATNQEILKIPVFEIKLEESTGKERIAKNVYKIVFTIAGPQAMGRDRNPLLPFETKNILKRSFACFTSLNRGAFYKKYIKGKAYSDMRIEYHRGDSFCVVELKHATGYDRIRASILHNTTPYYYAKYKERFYGLFLEYDTLLKCRRFLFNKYLRIDYSDYLLATEIRRERQRVKDSLNQLMKTEIQVDAYTKVKYMMDSVSVFEKKAMSLHEKIIYSFLIDGYIAAKPVAEDRKKIPTIFINETNQDTLKQFSNIYIINTYQQMVECFYCPSILGQRPPIISNLGNARAIIITDEHQRMWYAAVPYQEPNTTSRSLNYIAVKELRQPLKDSDDFKRQLGLLE
jgi:hypothetical protein